MFVCLFVCLFVCVFNRRKGEGRGAALYSVNGILATSVIAVGEAIKRRHCIGAGENYLGIYGGILTF